MFKVKKNLNSKRMSVLLVSIVVCFSISTSLPIEQFFIRFSSPEMAFSYSHNIKSLYKVINEGSFALAVYDDNDRLSFTHLSKDDSGWIMNNSSNDTDVDVVNNCFVISAKFTDHHKAIILIYDDENNQLSVEDSKGSNFINFKIKYDNVIENFCYSVIQIPNSDYIITVNGVSKKIELN